ncbi:hypothetical protein GCM10008955_24830 [Deinococcus malanensis]|uniref:Calcium-binding protein n=1 Tax=Deinococcus malanensis TaxID=1706855 RepID=A0ABQ2EZP9_9DEIO|nr:hypothetical protein [Deinococcus malanensis]GGK30110.1 hypothetical protein GCM10008955_24830 [Deinococcus malanensis]
MTDEHTRTDQPASTFQDQQTRTPEQSAPDVEEAVDESGASAGGGALSGSASQPGLHGVEDELAEAGQPARTPALDPDADGELAARLVDTDGDGTADDAVVNAPEAP